MPPVRRVAAQGSQPGIPPLPDDEAAVLNEYLTRRRRQRQEPTGLLRLLPYFAVLMIAVAVGGAWWMWRLSQAQDANEHPSTRAGMSPSTTPSTSPTRLSSAGAPVGEKSLEAVNRPTKTIPPSAYAAAPMFSSRVIVVGAGLAGQSAAITAAQNGAEVILLDKESRLGGNSAKATSGINGWGTHAQAAAGVTDGPKYFERDTFVSGKGGNCRPGLVRMLSTKSADAVEWLSSFGVPLTVLSQLGGHSRKRTHRAPDKPDGTPLPIGYTIVSTLEKHIHANLADKVRIEPDARMLRLLHETIKMPNGEEAVRVTGVEYEKRFPVPKGSDAPEKPAETRTLAADAIVLATGGFSNDHTDASLLTEYAPQLSSFPTTNGPWATGDGVKVAKAIGAQLVDMDKVQLHPTGLLNPKDPQAKTVFLGPEALRGSGGILLNKNGERFINELELRSVVSAAIIAQNNVYPGSGTRKFAYCVLNEAAADAFGRATLGFYWKKMGLFSLAEDVAALAEQIGCDEDKLKQTLLAYEKVSTAGEKCSLTGKSVYPCVLGPQGPFYVAYVTPSIHYTMGGCLISPAAEIQSEKTTLFGSRHRSIQGLFGAGEVTGGVHGKNRLGGNSLLECVVFGKIAGERAATAKGHASSVLPSAGSASWAKGVVEEFLPEDGDEGDASTRAGQLVLTLPSAVQTSGLALGQAVAIRGVHDGQSRVVYLPPSSSPSECGTISVFLPAPAAASEPTAWLYALQPGDTVELQAAPAPTGAAAGLSKRLASGEVKELVVVANAPDGVAAALSILRAAHEQPLRGQLAQVRLLYSAANASALSYRQLFDACRRQEASHDANAHTAAKYFDCKFVVANPPGRWTEGVGVIDSDALQEILPSAGGAERAQTVVVLSGSLAAMKPVEAGLLERGFAFHQSLFSFFQ